MPLIHFAIGLIVGVLITLAIIAWDMIRNEPPISESDLSTSQD